MAIVTANFDVAAQVDLVVRQNTDWPFSWTFTDSLGVAIDLTGYTFRFVVSDLIGNKVVDVVPTFSGNTVTCTVPLAKTNIPSGIHLYQMGATPPAGTSRIWETGRVIVQKSLI